MAGERYIYITQYIDFHMAIKDWPVWVKILGIVSIILIIPVIVFAGWMLLFTPLEIGGALILLLFILPFFGIIIGFWIFGFLFSYLKNHNLSIVANIIAAILLIASLGFSFWLIPGMSGSALPGFLILSSFPISVVIYSIIALIIINSKSK